MKKYSGNFIKWLWLCLGLLGQSTSYAEELTIDIFGGQESSIPVAIVAFSWAGKAYNAPMDIAAIVKTDLSHSGYFTLLSEQAILAEPIWAENINFDNWQTLGQEYLIIGHMNEESGQYNILVQVFDVFKGEQVLGYRVNASKRQLRQAAHQISDKVFQALTGKTGAFGSKIAYITRVKKANRQLIYQLQVADADGFNPITITASKEPLMSPTWSPDGNKIAYVSFEKHTSAIYIQTLATGQRVKVSAFRGINGAPAFSPDGKRMAVTLSKDGSPDIFIFNLINKNILKLTKNFAIDTEPTWSPDGRFIVFTSDRGGKPQLYKVPSTGGRAERLTFQGDYNARGNFSKDGKKLAMVHGNQGDFRIAVMDMATKSVSILTAGRQDESPSFAPNGEMLVYARRQGSQSVLAAVSIDGRNQHNLVFGHGEVREAAWSP